MPDEQVQAARAAVSSLDSRGTAVVLDRLQREGLLDQVVERDVLSAETERAMLGNVDALIPVSVLICSPISDAMVNDQITWAEEAYANAGLRFAVVDRQRIDEQEVNRILAGGAAGQVDMNSENSGGGGHEPMAEVAALLAEAWARYGDANVSHTVFVPAIFDVTSSDGTGVYGATFNSGNYTTATPGAITAAGAGPSTLAHEVGHLLGLPHIEGDAAEQASGQAPTGNLLQTAPTRGFQLTPGQVERIKHSLRTRLIPRGVRPMHTPRSDVPPAWRGDPRERPDG